MLCLYITSYYSAFPIPCETSRIFGGLMSTSIAFAHDLSPIYLTKFSFSNIPCGTSSFSEDLYRFLSHLRMPCFNFTSYYSLIAVSYRSVHVIRVSTRKILALRGLCAYRVFDPRFVSCWPMFANLSVVRRRSARCLLNLCSRLRQAQNRKQNIDTSRVIRSCSGAKTRQLFIICMISLPITSCYSCFL